MAQSPRQPKGPPLDGGWLSSRAAALSYLKQSREADEVAELVAAGDQGAATAEVMADIYTYRNWIVRPKGVTKPRRPVIRHDLFSRVFRDARGDLQADEWTHDEALASAVNPESVRVADGHANLRARSPLATIAAFASEAQEFVQNYDMLRRNAERLGRAFRSDPQVMKKLASMRRPQQMFTAFILMVAEERNYADIMPADLAALALQARYPEAGGVIASTPDAVLLRLKAWYEMKREVKTTLLPTVKKVRDIPLDDPEEPEKPSGNPTR